MRKYAGFSSSAKSLLVIFSLYVWLKTYFDVVIVVWLYFLVHVEGVQFRDFEGRIFQGYFHEKQSSKEISCSQAQIHRVFNYYGKSLSGVCPT